MDIIVSIIRILFLFGIPLIGSIVLAPLYVNYMKPTNINVGWDMLMLYQKFYLGCLVTMSVLFFFFLTYLESLLVGLVVYLSYNYAYGTQLRLFLVLELIGVMRYE